MSVFYVGQPVVCVIGGGNPEAERRYGHINWPEQGRHYRIRGIYRPMRTFLKRGVWKNMTFVLVHGVANRRITWPNGMVAEAAFWEMRFAPSTDIGSLRDIAAKVEFFMGDDGPRVDRKIRRRKKEDA